MTSNWVELDGQPGFRLDRTVLVSDAGIGKTTNLEWLHSQLNEPGGETVAFLVKVAELPMDPEELLPKVLLRQFRLAAGNGHNRVRSQKKRLLERLQRQGRLVLLLDALDQTPEDNAWILRSLKDLSNDPLWQECRIVISSRFFAVHQWWDKLFAGDPSWRFVQLQEFSEPEQRATLGDRYDAIPAEARQILSVPRVLDYVRQMKDEDLSALRTASDVYWFATKGMLTDGVLAREAQGLDPDEAQLLLSAIALEMTAAGNFDRAEVNEVFKGRIADRCCDYYERQGIRTVRNRDWIAWCRKKLNRLSAMNTFLENGMLEAGCTRQIQWRNRSLQEFYAALWLSKFGCEQDAQGVWDRVEFGRRVSLSGLSEDQGNNLYYWLWRYAAEMPADARQGVAWIGAMRPLYQTGDGTAQGTRRWSEMIYRSWRTMTLARQDDPIKACYQEDLLTPFQEEFKRELCSGVRGSSKRSVARGLLAEFRLVPKNYHSPEDLEFTMGSPWCAGEPCFYPEQPRKTKLDRPFELACFPVTNEQYELFNPRHDLLRHASSLGNRNPATYVNWLDAWCFCLWLGEEYRLLTEKEWEFACRAGSQGYFSLGEDGREVDLQMLGDYAWYYNNSGITTHPVGEKKANLWGLCDMHGNVWEWCDGRYDKDATDRVCRGGCYHLSEASCVSSNHYPFRPEDRHGDVGFRVARVAVAGKTS
ncbi:MAG: SUMF1/EgtB/PvdO family nonheme iron enzyme [Planctomycetaceae bacterium]|nr:SUMF1/EgtB/PvdO family nonheme iron enzyme [Planctomycetaceae bacterium]